MMNSANQQPIRSSAIVPPPPTGSILQKQSSFSRGRNSTTSAQAPSSTSANQHTNATTTAAGSITGSNTMMEVTPTHHTSSAMAPSGTAAAAAAVTARTTESYNAAAHNPANTRDSTIPKPTTMAPVAKNTNTGVNGNVMAKQPAELPKSSHNTNNNAPSEWSKQQQPNSMMMNAKDNAYPSTNNVRTSLDATSMPKSSSEAAGKNMINQPQTHTIQ